MKHSQAIEHAKKHSWWSEECPGALQYYYCIYSFAEQRMYFHPDYLTVAMLTAKNGFVQEKTPSDERLLVYAWLRQQYQDDHGFIDAEHDRWTVVRDELIAYGEHIVRDLPTMHREELRNAYSGLMARAIDSARWGVWIECVDDYNSFVLPDHLAEALPPDTTREQRTHVMMVLAMPLIVSFMEDFQAEKAKLLFQHRDTIKHAASWADAQSDSAFVYALEHLCSAYTWMSVNYSGSPALTPETLFAQLKKDEDVQSDADIERLLANIDTKIDRHSVEQATLERQYALPQDILDDFSIMRSMGAWMDERKESMVKTSWYISLLLERIAQATDVPKTELEWYTKEEILTLLDGGDALDSQLAKQRRELSVSIAQWDGESEGSELTIFTGPEADALYAELNHVDSKTLRGIVASQGSTSDTFTGTVQVIVDVSKDTFAPGNILVTTMTRPEFIPLLKHAAAIITDEGGITCHAAIVSRELGIPCIIGTQHATKQLQSGDRILMDMRSGTITQLS